MVGGPIAGVLTRLAAVVGILTRLAADQMKRVYAELGGNDATIVCADADLDKAAEAIVLGRLARGNGQICSSVKRVFVHASVYDTDRCRREIQSAAVPLLHCAVRTAASTAFR
jgi:acyl-CoA reductase-like NAD-dependent aldehyde dehydrogenase